MKKNCCSRKKWRDRIGGLLILFCIASPSLAQGPDRPEIALEKVRARCHALLEEALASEEAFVRSGAARALGESGDPAVVPLLQRAAGDFYPTTRQFALQALDKIDAGAAVQAARLALSDSNNWVQSTALDILSGRNAQEALTEIRKLLDAPDRMVRLAAHYALARLGEEGHFEAIADAAREGDAVARYQAITYLGNLADARSIQILVALLEDQDEEVLERSLKSLGSHVAMEQFRTLIRLSLHPQPGVRQEAVLALGRLPQEVTHSRLPTFCTDADALVRLAAAVAIHRQGGTGCHAVFGQALADSDFGVRSSAARILGQTPAADRPKLLARALSDPATRVRTAAVRAAGQMGGAEAFSLLVQMLDDPQPVIRAYAAGNLLRLMR